MLSVPLLLATQHRCAGAGVVRGVGCRVTRYILSSYWFILAAAVVVCMENIEELSLNPSYLAIFLNYCVTLGKLKISQHIGMRTDFYLPFNIMVATVQRNFHQR